MHTCHFVCSSFLTMLPSYGSPLSCGQAADPAPRHLCLVRHNTVPPAHLTVSLKVIASSKAAVRPYRNKSSRAGASRSAPEKRVFLCGNVSEGSAPAGQSAASFFLCLPAADTVFDARHHPQKPMPFYSHLKMLSIPRCVLKSVVCRLHSTAYSDPETAFRTGMLPQEHTDFQIAAASRKPSHTRSADRCKGSCCPSPDLTAARIRFVPQSFCPARQTDSPPFCVHTSRDCGRNFCNICPFI